MRSRESKRASVRNPASPQSRPSATNVPALLSASGHEPPAAVLDRADGFTADSHPPRAAPPATPVIITASTRPVVANILRLEAGLHSVAVVLEDASSKPSDEGDRLGGVWLSKLPAPPTLQLDILSASAAGDQWLGKSGDAFAVRAPLAGGWLVATALGSLDRAPKAPSFVIRGAEATATATRAVARRRKNTAVAPVASKDGEREIPLEIIVHIERIGDRSFPGSTWAGQRGEQRRVEGFSIKPLGGILPDDLEYKALRRGGIETPWTPGGQFCGTRGQSLPLIGLAMRIAPHLQERFSVVYQASFFHSGIIGPCSNGSPCLPRAADDQLEAINIRVVETPP